MTDLIHVVDVGALPLPHSGTPLYAPLVKLELARVTPFDPQMGGLAIGDGKPATMHICTYEGWASLLRPSETALNTFPSFREQALVIDEGPIETHQLDCLNLAPIDFLKVDAQGSELAVLEGARTALKQAAAVQIEVPFVGLYENQPPFWAIDRELHAQGFLLHAFVGIKRWPIANLMTANAPNQLLEADAIYVRDYVHGVNAMTDRSLQSLSQIAKYCLGSLDLALHCENLLTKRRI